MKKIIFYGPTGKKLPPNKLGGGERGCQRTISLYEKLGLQVVVIEKPNLGRGKLHFLYNFLITPFILVITLLKHSNTPIHITGFYENQLFYEYMNAGKVYCEYPMIAFTMEKVQGILFVIDNANLLLNDEMWQ